VPALVISLEHFIIPPAMAWSPQVDVVTATFIGDNRKIPQAPIASDIQGFNHA
jgi:hypothetical protein